MAPIALSIAIASLLAPSAAPLGRAPTATVQQEPSPERIQAAVDALEAAAKGSDAAAYTQTILASRDAVDKRVIALLAQALKSKQEGAPLAAIQTLGYMRHPESVSALTGYYKRDKKALTDDEPKLAELLKSIGRLGSPEGVATLVDSPFSAKSYPVIRARLLGLGAIRDTSSIQALFDLLEKVAVRDLDRYMADIRLALVQLSGEDQGDDPRQWKAWWQDNKRGYKVSVEPKPLPEAARQRWNEYWGIQEKREAAGH